MAKSQKILAWIQPASEVLINPKTTNLKIPIPAGTPSHFQGTLMQPEGWWLK